MDDAKVLALLRSGGRGRDEAISFLYRTYARRFAAYLLRHGVPGSHADDLVQDAFVRIAGAVDRFDGNARFEAWMWTILRNTMVSFFRRATSAPDGELDVDMLPGVSSDGDHERRELIECVRAALREFARDHPERARAVSAAALGELSNPEMAEALGRSAGATRQYLYECRREFRRYLERCRDLLAP